VCSGWSDTSKNESGKAQKRGGREPSSRGGRKLVGSRAFSNLPRKKTRTKPKGDYIRKGAGGKGGGHRLEARAFSTEIKMGFDTYY